MKQTLNMTLFFLSVITLCSVTNASSFKESNTKKQLDLTFPKGAKIFFQGWGKYFYTSKQIVKPTEFFVNNAYFSQRYPATVAKTGDSNGSFVIPNESSFFFVLYSDNLAIYSARDEIIRNSADSLNIADILPVPEDDFLLGGIKNLGKFKAGFCMKVRVKSPAAYNAVAYNNLNWFFCFDDNNQKSKFLKSLAKIKILDQRSKDQIVTAQAVSDEDLTKKTTKGKGPEDEKDGKMVLLQDWSECTLKCGGGKSFQQWMCIPPKQGGKPCQGDTIRVQDCNTDPCPEIRTAEDEEKATQPETNKKPIVKITRFSQRYNRYTRCVLQETDVFRVDEEGNKLPSRLMLNPNTLTIFGNDDYTNKVESYNVGETDFKILPDFCCFELTDKSKKKKFCGFDTACGDPEKNEFVVDLSNVFKDFKTVCNKGKATKVIDDEDMKKIKSEKQKTMQLQNFEVESEKAEQANEQLEEETNNKVFQKIKDTQKSGLKALEREVMIESLIKKDEERKEDVKEHVIYQELEQEKQKNKSINQQIKEKELEADFQMQDYQAEKDVKEAKQEIVEQIEVNRDNLKKQIEEIRKEAKKRRQTLQTKLKKIKSKITKKLMKATKEGNKAKCLEGLRKEALRTSYCGVSHPDDYLELTYCQDEENFCYSCCDSEFGLLKPASRDDCYETCDSERDKIDKEKEKAAAGPVKKDQWQWKASKKSS